MAERTEPATPKRLREARQRGQVARSDELVAGVLLCVGGMILGGLGPAAVGSLARFAARLLALAPAAPPPPGLVLSAGLVEGVRAIAPLLLLLGLLGGLATVAQVGAGLHGKVLAPRLDRLDPVAGLRRLFGGRGLYGLAKGVIVVVLLGALLGQTLLGLAPETAGLAGAGPAAVAALLGQAISRLLVRAGAGLVALGLADLLVARWRLGRDLRMTKEEVRRELREEEGDPRHRQERLRLHREIAVHARIEDVARADCVVVNPEHLAVALLYEEDRMDAPRVLVKGERRIAERIVAVARANGVPIVRDVALAHALVALDLDEEIPEELYEAVAAVLRVAYEETERADPGASP